jgi:octaprenyl-diphosphate synthase
LDAANAVIARQTSSVNDLAAMAAADMAGVDSLILSRMQSPVSVIPALADHIIEAGGKRLRPLLTVVAARGRPGRRRAQAGGCRRIHPHRDPVA